MPIVVQGATLDPPFQLEARNSSGDLADPTNLSLTFTDSLGVPQAGFPVTYPGSIIKDSIGRYHYDYTIPLSLPLGTYYSIWSGILLGAPETAQEQWEVVLPGSLTTGPLDFLQNPNDYDSIRGLLGVTTLDVEDSDIDLTSFAPQAEYLVKARISNWSTQMLNTDQLYVLRLATMYKTACLMAESFVRGGTIGLARPLSTGEGRDWAAAAEQFCARYEYWVSIADQSDTPDIDSDYTIKPLWRSGPTAARLRRQRAMINPEDWWWYRFPPYWKP